MASAQCSSFVIQDYEVDNLSESGVTFNVHMRKFIPVPSWSRFGQHRVKAISTSRNQYFFSTKREIPKPVYPRAAVAATIQWTCPKTNLNHYLLVQRKNPPDKNKWSFPGGKIELGEETLLAAKREILEETQLRGCLWHSDPFLTTDAIVVDNEDKKDLASYAFHYVIAHCFARIPACESDSTPTVIASDDALNAKWWTVEKLHTIDCSAHTIKVIERAEELSRFGVLSV